jgi:hypothetical protein
MNKRAEKVEVTIEELKDSAASENGTGVVLETEAVVDGALHDASIEVLQDDIPAVAVALLNTEADASASNDAMPRAVRCLGAGVVHVEDRRHVRFHLQFDSGQVLPIEMSRDAALALCRGLFHHTDAAQDFDPGQWGVGTASRPAANS